MSYVLKIWGWAGGQEPLADGQFLKAFDEADDGSLSTVEFTANTDNAMKFESLSDAFSFWKTQSTTVPLRPDGEPNRPLTAFNVEVINLERNPSNQPLH